MCDFTSASYVHLAEPHEGKWTVLHRRGDQFLGRTICLDEADARDLAAALSRPPTMGGGID